MMDCAPVIQKALKSYCSWELKEEIVDSLPIFGEYCQRKFASNLYANTEVLFIQHHLGPLIPKLRAMFDYGLEPSRCWFVDIPYSTNQRVREELVKIGVPANHMLKTFDDPIEPYSKRQIERVAHIVGLLGNQDDGKRLLVIDDGAYFVRVLDYLQNRDEKLMESFKKRGTHIVEQTTRGHRYLEGGEAQKTLDSLNISAVSIARARTKYQLESPFIGAAVSQKMKQALEEIDKLGSGLGRVLVIGFGAVGEATTQRLSQFRHDGPIHVWDTDWVKLQGAIEASKAYPLTSFPEEGSYNCVFGCTGYASFPVDGTEILANGALLASGSSAAIEFNREKFIDLAYLDDKDDFYIVDPENTRNDGIHAKITMQKGNKRFSFLNAGFPINFDGRIECLPDLIIQITHGLLLAASRQTMSAAPGLHPINSEDDEWFLNRGLYWIEKFADSVVC